jgi:hypothetical protein
VFIISLLIGYSITDYKISTAFGGQMLLALALVMDGHLEMLLVFDRSNLFTIGTIYRPASFLSFSLIANLPSNGEREGIIGAGIRPLYKL